MKYLLNYANLRYYEFQSLSTKQAYENGFDFVYQMKESDIDEIFKEKNKSIFYQFKGAGYWIWKPYLILKVLKELKDNDYLLYLDSGACVNNSIEPLIDTLKNSKQDILCFGLNFKEKMYTKRDTFINMNLDYEEYTNSNQINAGIQLIKKTEFSVKFYEEYLNWVLYDNNVTDSESKNSNYPEFIEHRHDQSIFSLLCKKYKFEVFRDPSQWGNVDISKYNNSPYGQIIVHHRNPK